MPLFPCRGCGQPVDRSALACPGCGATDPAKKISRQLRNAIIFTIQFVTAAILIFIGSQYLWNTFIPLIKQYLGKV